jgi:hypothetical protein
MKAGFSLARLDLELVDTPGGGIVTALAFAPTAPAGLLLPGLGRPLVVFPLGLACSIATLGAMACP